MRDGSRRGSRSVPKGRQIDPAALAEVRRLLGAHERRRDLLIEHLHSIQDSHGHIGTDLLAALAQEMRLSFAEVFEVATFYAHFDVTDAKPQGLTVRLCDGIACALEGAEALAGGLQHLDGARVVRVPCMLGDAIVTVTPGSASLPSVAS